MSPVAPAARSDGNPVHHLLVDRRAQRRRIPAIALERRLRARRRAPAARPRASRSAVVTPGATTAASSASTSATSSFAARIRSISAGDLQTITAARLPTAAASPTAAVHRRRDRRPAAGCRRPAGTSAAPVELDQRLRLARDRPAAARARSSSPSSRRVHQRAAALAARPSSSATGAFAPQRAADPPRRAAAAPATSSGTSMSSDDQRRRVRPSCRRAPSPAPTVRGNPSSTNPSRASGRASRSPDDADHHVVADEPARVHRPSARRCPSSRARPAPPRAGCRRSRSCGRPRARREPLGLRALARSRRAEHHDVECGTRLRYAASPTALAARGCASSS